MRLAPLLLIATTAAAHPLGSDAYSLRSGLEATDQGVRAIVIGEVPIAVVITELGQRAGGTRPTQAQVDAYTAERQQQLAEGLTLTIDGAPVQARFTPSASALNGRAIEGFFTYIVDATVPPSTLDDDVTVVLANTAWPEVPMVTSAQVRARGPWTVHSHDAPADWADDERARTVTARFVRGGDAP